MTKVYLAGEGRFELGGWAAEREYQEDRAGLIEALARSVVPDGWAVCGGRPWKDIPKFRARPGETAEAQNVRGAALDARDAGCDVLVFVRDRDRDDSRRTAIERAQRELLKEGKRIAGGVACECADAWLLAILGERRSESLPSAAAKQRRVAVAADTDAAVAVVEKRGLGSVAEDATSLRQWLADVARELALS